MVHLKLMNEHLKIGNLEKQCKLLYDSITFWHFKYLCHKVLTFSGILF